MERYEVLFSGQVQGVGFRMTTRQLARRFPVSGYVENLAGGNVHMVVEGDQKSLDELLSTIERRMSGFIRERKLDRRPATGEFDDFSIRY
jgi:acylphosphatase